MKMSETKKEILIVDDEEQMRLALRRMLEKEGYSVREAENGEKAIKIHREKQADLIITDIIMPDKEGLGTIVELKSEFPDIKIFAMSGGGKNSPDQYLRMAKGLGVDKVFIKPFNREDILSAVAEILG
jgi:YesN/AraC family two-component response regulator